MPRVANDTDNNGVRDRAVGAADVMTERSGNAAEEMARQALVDDGNLLRSGAVGRGKITTGKKRNTERLEIPVADPGNLNIELFVRFGRITGHNHTADHIVVGKVGIIGGSHGANPGQDRNGLERTLFDGRDLARRITR